MTSPPTTPQPPQPTDRPRFLVHVSVAVMDGDGRLLIVQEEKPALRGRWNLPGGHTDHGEPLVRAAERELREETCIEPRLDGLLGVYSTRQAQRFVFRAALRDDTAGPQAGDEILDVRFVTLDELITMPDDQLVSPDMFRAIVRDLKRNASWPLDLLVHCA